MGANELRVVVGRMKARNDEHAQKEGLKESESLKARHDQRARLRTAAAQLSVLRQRLDRASTTDFAPSAAEWRDHLKVVAELAQLVDLLFREVLASGASS